MDFRFKQSNYLDCRINAYSKHDIIGDPNFLFIDIDCTSEVLLNDVLAGKLRSIEAYPTVLFTGSGYHLYQPIDCTCIRLDKFEIFSKFAEPSRQFLRFAERYLSDDKCDPNHNPSFKSCMVRIPGSINSKNNLQVRIVQYWDNERPDIRLLLGSFYAWLLTEDQKRIKYFDSISNSNFRKSRIN